MIHTLVPIRFATAAQLRILYFRFATAALLSGPAFCSSCVNIVGMKAFSHIFFDNIIIIIIIIIIVDGFKK